MNFDKLHTQIYTTICGGHTQIVTSKLHHQMIEKNSI